MTSIEGVKTVLGELKTTIKEGSVTKYFTSRTEFVKLVEPITKRYRELV